MRTSLLEMKQVVEPAGAVALAALLSPGFARIRSEGVMTDGGGGGGGGREGGGRRPLRTVAAIICGGNVDPGTLAHVLNSPS
jgi:threonine dehydratase